MNLVEELQRIKSKLDDKVHQSPAQLKIWRRKAAWLRRKINEGLEKIREEEKRMKQLPLKLNTIKK